MLRAPPSCTGINGTARGCSARRLLSCRLAGASQSRTVKLGGYLRLGRVQRVRDAPAAAFGLLPASWSSPGRAGLGLWSFLMGASGTIGAKQDRRRGSLLADPGRLELLNLEALSGLLAPKNPDRVQSGCGRSAGSRGDRARTVSSHGRRPTADPGRSGRRSGRARIRRRTTAVRRSQASDRTMRPHGQRGVRRSAGAGPCGGGARRGRGGARLRTWSARRPRTDPCTSRRAHCAGEARRRRRARRFRPVRGSGHRTRGAHARHRRG